MEDFTVGDILEATGGCLVKGDFSSAVSGISTDSRTLTKGEFFVALVGDRFDGHDFIAQAADRCAGGAVVSRDMGETPIDTVVLVDDTLKALGDIAGLYRSRFDIPVVGITGSNGKTSTKDMTASVLERKYSVLKNKGNLNNAIGVPLTLFKLSGKHEVAVIEMGTGAPGEMARLVEIVQPNVAVVTNVGPTHQEFFGSVDEVATEKAVLVRAAGSAVLNADDPRVAKMGDVVDGTTISFGLVRDALACATVSADEVGQDQNGEAEFTLVMGQDRARVHLRAIGKHNVYNALAAASVGKLLHIDINEIRDALESYHGTPMRMQKEMLNGVTIINDAYNSNPASLIAAVELLSEIECSGKRVAVIGDMLELGERSDEYHRAAGRSIAGYPVDVLVTVGDEAAKIAKAALGAGFHQNRVIICKSISHVVTYLSEALKVGDAALIKGSRGMKMEEIIKALGRDQRTAR